MGAAMGRDLVQLRGLNEKGPRYAAPGPSHKGAFLRRFYARADCERRDVHTSLLMLWTAPPRQHVMQSRSIRRARLKGLRGFRRRRSVLWLGPPAPPRV